MIGNLSFGFGHSKLKRIFHQSLGKWLINQTRLHVTTEMEEKESLTNIANQSTIILPNILDLPEVQTIKVEENNAMLKLVSLSRIHPIKQIDLVLENLAKVSFEWQLEVIGTGDQQYMQSLKKLTEELNISDKVKWLGWLNGDCKYEHLNKADLLILCSYTENFANVIIESLALGVPVLISNKVGLKDYVLEKKFGWVTSLKKRDLKKKLEDAYLNKSKRRRIRQSAPTEIIQDFGPRILGKQYIDCYQDIMNRGSINK